MALEIEGKFRLSDPVAFRERLAAAGAEAAGKVLEHNTYFDTPDGRLRAGDCGLRVRVIQGPGAPPRAVLTYKGPRRPGELKVREEAETPVDSAQAVEAILTALGFSAKVRFQKRRESFRLGGARVELDELPELGFFVEIEAEEERTVQQVRRALGLGDAPAITASYVQMVAEHLAAEPGSATKELKF